ncbi:MAG: hypothetical protein FXF47_02360 [Candidatus Mcinerneyibacterium aminivorans]|uniref:Na+/H+ antiporter MnhB subunit-related protein domain-containing protein n=1 Tax=Candidatus Mcinerneyibacterium aminivorans TaxID=2703815 RepID=A0A5D0MH50_9BACT|nr:MAG: hypothetical protein FXF47_02360 [Candidatus Mcinerneyibacterium aminivorans]
MINNRDSQGMSVIVKTITRLTIGLILLYGVYILLHGHITPGGGFAGGVIIALSFIHIMLAFGKNVALEKLNQTWSKIFESTGALLFITIAFLGFFGGVFFNNFLDKGEHFELFSAGTILLSNIAIFLKVGAGLFLLFVALVLFKIGGRK